MLGCYQYNAIGSTNTINGSRSIFQYRYRFYFIGIHTWEIALVTRNTINHDQRLTQATDINGIIEFTGLWTFLCNTHTGYFSGKHIHHILILSHGNFLIINSWDCTCQSRFLLRTVTYNYYFFQCLAIFLQSDFQYGISCRDYNIQITDKGNCQFIFGRGFYLEHTVYISDCSSGSTAHPYVCSDNRLARIINDGSLNHPVLSRHRQCRQEA